MPTDKNILMHPIVNGVIDTTTNLYPRTKFGNVIDANIENGSGNGSAKTITDAVTWTLDNEHSTYHNTTITTDATGKCSTALGGKSCAYGSRSVSEGTQTYARGNYSHAEGNNSVSEGGSSHAEGLQTTAKGGDGSHSEGKLTLASGASSHAQGVSTQATATGSHAEGNGTRATSNYAHAQGNNTQATATCAFAGGTGSVASCLYGFATGRNAKANPTTVPAGTFVKDSSRTATQGAISLGWNTTSRGDYSVVLGYETKNDSSSNSYGLQGVLITGRYNASMGHAMFEIGNGYYDNSNNAEVRRNAFTVFDDGRTVVGHYCKNPSGALFEVANGASGAPSDAFTVFSDGHAELGLMGNTSSSVATKDYVDTHIPANVAITTADNTFSGNNTFTGKINPVSVSGGTIGLVFPSTSGFTADKTLATTDQLPTFTATGIYVDL